MLSGTGFFFGSRKSKQQDGDSKLVLRHNNQSAPSMHKGAARPFQGPPTSSSAGRNIDAKSVSRSMATFASGNTLAEAPARSFTKEYRIVGSYNRAGAFGSSAGATIMKDGSLVPADRVVDTELDFAKMYHPEPETCAAGRGWGRSLYLGKQRETFVSGIFHEINFVLKERNAELKTLLTIGGNGEGEKLAGLCENESTRRNFAKSCVDFIMKYGFDGINVGCDPTILENSEFVPTNYTWLPLFLQDLRDFASDLDVPLCLTLELPPVPKLINRYDAVSLALLVDFLLVLCYDLRGQWSAYTGHCAPLYRSTKDPLREGLSASFGDISCAHRFLVKKGIDSDKIVLVGSFSGRAFGGIKRESLSGGSYGSGLFVPFDTDSTPPGTWNDGSGVYEYWHIKELLSEKSSMNFEEFWDSQCKAATLLDQEKGIFMSFENARSIVSKCKFIIKNALGGFGVSDLSFDIRPEDMGKGLIDFVAQYLKGIVSTKSQISMLSKEAGPKHINKLNCYSFREIESEITKNAIEEPLSALPVRNRIVLGFFNNWSLYEKNFLPSAIPFDHLTHLHYGYAKVTANGLVMCSDEWADTDKPFPGEQMSFNSGDDFPRSKNEIRGCINQINFVFKPLFPALKSVISVGGWNFSQHFSTVLGNAASRSTFAKSATDFMIKYGFDGVDIVWEYPVAGGADSNERSQYDGWSLVYVCSELKREMQSRWTKTSKSTSPPPWTVSVALPAHFELIKNIPIRSLASVVDYCHLLSFDMKGAGWSKRTGHHSPLYPNNTNTGTSSTSLYNAVSTYMSNGLYPEKIVIGIPTHGRGFAGVQCGKKQSGLPGLSCEFDGVPAGTYDGRVAGEMSGVFDYSDIHYSFLSTENCGMDLFWDPAVRAHYLYGQVTCTDEQETNIMISFESLRSVEEKCFFINAYNLGGFALSDLSGDLLGSNASLLSSGLRVLGSGKSAVPSWLPEDLNVLKPLNPPSEPRAAGDFIVVDSGVQMQPFASKLTTSTPTSPDFPKMIVGYFIAWGIYARAYRATDIPIEKLTHLNYAFARIQDGTWTVQIGDPYADTEYLYPGQTWDPTSKRGNFEYINNQLRARNPNLKTLISIGGWTWSGNFSTMAGIPSARTTFAKSCADFLIEWGFDGIDLDWEYPVEGGLESNVTHPQDGVNYTLLCHDIRRELDLLSNRTGRTYLLTIAAPAGPTLAAHLEIANLAEVLDFINVMTYDYRGGWSPLTGHQTPLYPSSRDPYTVLGSNQEILQTYLDQGCPPSKLVLGAAMYGRGWQGVAAGGQDGIFQPYQSVPMGTWDALGNEGATGVYDYKDIVSRQMPSFWDDEVKAPWVYDPNRQGGLLISYDDPRSIKEKCWFINAKSLGGIMFWELSGDLPDSNPGNLLNVMVDVLGRGELPDGPRPGINSDGDISAPNNPQDPAPGPEEPEETPETPEEPQTPDDGSNEGNGTGGQVEQPEVPPDSGNPPSAEVPQPPSGLVVVGRYTFWSALNGYTPDQIPLDQMTHLIYSHATVDSSGTVAPANQFTDLSFPYGEVNGAYRYINERLKPLYPGLKTLIRIGGFSGSSSFPQATMAQNRDTFVQSIANFASRYGFDGVEIAWEWPGVVGSTTGSPSADMSQFANFMSSLRSAMAAQIVVCSVPGSESLQNNFPVSALHMFVDWFNVQTFDYTNGSSAMTGHAAPLNANDSQSVASSVDRLTAVFGVPYSKIVIGIPFFGRAWKGITDFSTNGLGVAVSESNLPEPPTATNMTTGSVNELGLYQYRYIRRLLNTKKVASAYYAESGASLSYCAEDGLVISHESRQTVDAKSAFVIERGLGGVFAHEVSGDSLDMDLMSGLYANLVVGSCNSIGDKPSQGKPPSESPPVQAPNKIVAGYYLGKMGDAPVNFGVETVAFDHLTHLIYGHASPRNGVLSTTMAQDEGNFAKIRSARSSRSFLRLVIAVSDSQSNLSGILSRNTDSEMRTFANSCIAFVERYGFDGLFLEYKWVKSSEEGQTLLRVCELIQAAARNSTLNSTFQLSLLLPWISSISTFPSPSVYYPILSLSSVVDFFVVQCFDFVAPGTPYATYRLNGHNSSIDYNTQFDSLKITSMKSSVEGYKSIGVEESKLIASIPFFGRAFDGVPVTWQNGLYLFYASMAKGTEGYGSNIIPYRKAKDWIASSTLTRFVDSSAGAVHAFGTQLSSTNGSGYFLTYEDEESVELKAQFALEHGLSGILCWELSSDDSESSLLKKVWNTMTK